MHKEVDSQPRKKPKKNCGNRSVALLKNSKQSGCRAAAIQVDFAEGHTTLETEAQRTIPKRYITQRKNRERKGASFCCLS